MLRVGTDLKRLRRPVSSTIAARSPDVAPSNNNNNNTNNDHAISSTRTSLPELEELLGRRDFEAAVSLLQVERANGSPPPRPKRELWHAYCLYHAGAYNEALAVYTRLMHASGLESQDPLPDPYASPDAPLAEAAAACAGEMNEAEKKQLPLLKALCHFALLQANKGLEEIQRVPPSPMQRRLLLLLRLQQQMQQQEAETVVDNQDEWEAIDKEIKALEEGEMEDMICAAACHFLRCRYANAANIYNVLLSNHPDAHALKIYLALCYFRLGRTDDAKSLAQVCLASSS